MTVKSATLTPMTTYIMVLNDGETFTDLDNCYIMAVPDDLEIDEIEDRIAKSDGTDYVVRFETDVHGRALAVRSGGGVVSL